MRKSLILPVILILISLALAILSYIILPSEVIIQISMGSQSNTTAPKLIAILILFALGAGGATFSMINDADKAARNKAISVSAIGNVLFIITIAVNSMV